MQLTDELIGLGFSIEDVSTCDLAGYIDVKRDCFRKYVDEYYGGWIEDTQVKMNTDVFSNMLQLTCFKKLLLHN